MSDVRTLDIRLLDEAFEMQSGYVLDFSDRTMGNFFLEELNLDIDDPKWEREGTSKAKRLRCFLRTVDNATAARTIRSLWEYRQAFGKRDAADDGDFEGRVLDLVGKLSGTRAADSAPSPEPARNSARVAELRRDLIAVSGLAPQARGYAFEKFLRGAFNLYGMMAKNSFRLRGEEIDGSFVLDHETYLFEAKWRFEMTGVDDLLIFDGKLGSRAAWARGLFVSYTGFSEGGLHAFGRGRRTICMNGQDFDEALSRELPLDHVIREKVRRAVETGAPFTPVRDL
ncbi:hypothetical protein EH31_10330 [Erythrobacter longus]|uniref:Restriction endonuclease type IV Mrr domain-containing protein n=1 Tax=Erythrobacter longus TaxID=1044 RepID=A0A074MCI0_ERYLO|nr:DUF3644 domain-containing protein [Erythrobacter longus]KEO90475.1 hypothetical protein EH31_10330 [Erythrobacter longus]